LHYFARPHDSIPHEPTPGPKRWRADELEETEWIVELDPAQRDALDAAVEALETDPRPTAELGRYDVPLPELSAWFDDLRARIEDGRGFVLVRGVPIERWSASAVERFFWVFGLHLGVPGAQNPQGDLLGHVRDTGAATDGSVRQYRTNERIEFHCDLADVVGLLCVRPAREGGRSRIASSLYAHDAVLRRRPDLVPTLYRPFRLDTKGEGGVPYIPIEPCRHYAGHVRTFWHAGYFRSVERYPRAAPLEEEQRQVLDLYDEILSEPGVALEMDLRPGDIQLLSNHTIVHGRGGFNDDGGRGSSSGRHLLRLWISLPHQVALGERLNRELNRLRVVGRLLRLRARSRVG
jgi:hypothetical protein